jgi:hypothetical protein
MDSDLILFLDYDGVLHPNEVYRYHSRGIVLECEGHDLFEYAEILAEMIASHPKVTTVLSTSWVPELGFDRARSYLPDALNQRVHGATWHSALYDKTTWFSLARYEQIAAYVRRHALKNWIAIDDDDHGWADNQRHHLVHTDELEGLSKMRSQELLKEMIERWGR